MNSRSLVMASVVIAGCAGATPEPVVGAAPADVQVVAVAPPAGAKVEAKAALPVEAAKPSDEKTPAHADEEKTVEVGGSVRLTGTGLQDGTGRGIGSIGTFGPGAEIGPGQGFGNGRLGGSHPSPSHINTGATDVRGRLPPEVIQRVVRQNFGRFLLCYELGLKSNPQLAGKVTAHFVIDKAGAVVSATDGGSDLKDAAAVSCILRVFPTLAFPAPEGGIVVVNYPLMFSPGDPPPPPPAAKPSP